EYWLKHIETFGGNSPLLVVINKIDQNPGFDVNRKFLQDKYPFIKGFFRLSCKTEEGIDSFYKNLRSQMSQVEHLNTLWPKSWFNVKTRLESMKDNYISYDRYEEICLREHIDVPTEQTTLVDYLNDLGVILHFNDPALCETNVINPGWITAAVYDIINSRLLADNKGFLNIESLEKILDLNKYPRKKHGYIIELMRKFELCYNVGNVDNVDTNAVLIPDLLNVAEPEFDFDYENCLNFYLQYDVLLKSIMARFIVKRNKEIKNDLRWRTGVVLENKSLNATAVVKADVRDKKILIHVSGALKRDWFAVLRHTFREIHDGFEYLVVKEMVPLPDKPADNKPLALEYDELISLECMGISVLPVGKLNKNYDIKQLLNGVVSESDRKAEQMERAKTGVNTYIAKNLTVIHKANINQETTIDIKVDINIELPALQGDFDELKKLLVKQDAGLREELKELGDYLDSVHPGNDK
ncbi:MAG: hypothetical protein GY757_26510, partial [bacterium]|nr:hypothetical protein [bacterium]